VAHAYVHITGGDVAMMGGNAVHRHHLRPQTACYHSLHTSKMSTNLNTQTSGASFHQACPLAQILCSPPPSQAAAAPLRQILRSAAPSPRNEGAAAAAPLSQNLCSPPPSRSPAAAAPLRQILWRRRGVDAFLCRKAQYDYSFISKDWNCAAY
jgi:hypothetical protein